MSRGPEDRLFQPENADEFNGLLLQVASNAVETKNPIGLVAILRSYTEYLARNLVNIGGYDLDGAYEDGWQTSYSALENVLSPTAHSNRLKPVVKLILDKEDEVFKTEPPLREQIDTPGRVVFYDRFGKVALGN